MDKNTFNSIYEGLYLFEKIVLQMISIIYEPSSAKQIERCLNEAGIKTSQDVKTVLHKLETLQLIRENAYNAYECNEPVNNIATLMAVQDGTMKKMVSAVQKTMPVASLNADRIFRDMRIGFYTKDVEQTMNKYKLGLTFNPGYFHQSRVFSRICNMPFDSSWFKSLPITLQLAALDEIIDYAIIALEPLNDFTDILLQHKNNPNIDAKGDDNSHMLLLLATVMIFQGRLPEASDVIGKSGGDFYTHYARGALQFFKGNTDKSIEEYETALKLLQKVTKKRNIFFNSILGVLFFIAKLRKGDTEFIYRYAEIVNKIPYYRHHVSLRMIETVCSSVDGGRVTTNGLTFFMRQNKTRDFIAELIYNFALYYIDSRIPLDNRSQLYESYQQASSNGYPIMAMDMAELIAIVMTDRSELIKPELTDFVQQTRQQTGGTGIMSLLALKTEAWERSLNAIIGLFQSDRDADAMQKKSRLVWQLHIDVLRNSCVITPREQRRLKTGAWSGGKNVALKRIYNIKAEKDLLLTPQDINICSTLEIDKDYSGMCYRFDTKRALLEMADHPLLFVHDSNTERIELKKGVPELIVDNSKGGYILKVSPFKPENDDVVIVKEATNKYRVVEFKEEHKKLYSIIGTKGLLVPVDAKDKVLQAVSNISSIVQVHSSMAMSLENARDIHADAHPHIRLLPYREGLKVEMTIRPFGDAGPYLKPGVGGINLLIEIDGKPCQTRRDFEQEKKNASDVINTSAILQETEQNDWEWVVEDPQSCLQLLVELREIGDGVMLEWPEGQRYSVTKELSFDSLRLALRHQTDWFSVSGSIAVDESTVLELKQVLELLDGTEGRFVKLDEGRYILLTRQLKKRLEDMKAYAHGHAKDVRMHPLAAVTLQDFFDDVKAIDVDSGWREYVKKVADAGVLDPAVPSTLQVELRDYQVEGFKWLSRLAHWGVGATLADDMGLGKTLEALAVIIERGVAGASLVVVPTSVQSNWQREAERFAPTLNVVIFGGKDRRQILEALKPNDLVLCTYGLLQSEVELLAEVNWQTIVLDEAQAIKNFATKRSQAAMKLKGGFKLITTGTPIENHLGELWNLFNFINPGLLGSLARFNDRFAIPIEKYNNREARQRLKRLVQPFILRRTKSQVLEELPSRTEIVLEVEMSEHEAAFYEALRQRAIERIEMAEGESGQKLIGILAELMRLRRACCNPRLVNQEVDIPSSKLNLFAEVLEELLDNKHKVLVFSQFVDHLQIIRQFLESKSVSYQYLDGSTPIKDRAKAVEDFQAGTGDVFLISIKAGGFGLNLTAADYVIHMDPWWNPAVEDQASDRAHRIGQKRPVTIYKLITKNTIEEKIVKLHENKKELANSLLEGTELSSKVSADELIALIKEL
ncbi:MAG: DEAD/DEAH box helicase [Nitrospirae bacterium]|uniref:DEAD/DEAH box helicase n=1 Tax=Candidatus Magnetobacterium casense TaxID=1455061 RepID=UPI00058D5F53|nr:DEAD/DEAH box helicase [Candidatus Magnetobacterium casensis]MBF0337447.1 DEAD/DEAH box helicase [Nitrospirota bacterium]